MQKPGDKPWVNWSGTQRICPRRVAKPKCIEELRELMLEVEGRAGQLKPVATGLSFSDILRSDDTLVEVMGLTSAPAGEVLLPLEQDLWRAPCSVPLVRFPCEARIRHLNAALASAGLGFTNLGGYDGQTMVGAISTSTHGSGLTLPPLADAVQSLDLMTSGGRALRIEPTGGLTDPQKFQHRYGAKMTLIQDDAWFWPCVVSLGCMGIITSVTMAVSPAYMLEERQRIRRWSEVERELSVGYPLHKFRNYEVLINPYRRRDGDYDCFVTERNIAGPDTERRPLSDARRSAESVTFLATTQRQILSAMKSDPRWIPGFLRAGFEALETGLSAHVDHSYIVYNVGKINTADVMSGEYFYPLEGNLFLKAVARLLRLVEENCRRGVYQASPLALRFVAGSRAPLSMVRGEPHCAIEIACFNGLPYAADALLSYELLCLELGGRPHWAQVQELTGKPGWLAAAYPALRSWLDVYRAFNAQGLFNNHFTDRLGISLPV